MKLLIAGAGGHSKSVLDSIDTKKYDDIVTIDTEHEASCIDYFQSGYREAFIAIGSIGNASRRIAEFRRLKKIGFSFPVIIDKSAIVSDKSELAEGVFIGKGAIVNAEAKIDGFAIINSGAIIDHDCVIGSFVHIAPGVSMSGGVHIGDNSHVGTGSSIIQNIQIGSNSIIGAGSTVVSDIPDNVTAFGVPCRIRHENKGIPE
jgi:sugar O-acyltransferase (sialic acid O-acetyltransferase NeuD family)